MQNLNHKHVMEKVKQKVSELIDSDFETNSIEEIKTDGNTTIHIHQDLSPYLLVYLYLANHIEATESNEKHINDLLQQIDRLRQKNSDFYEEIINENLKLDS